MGKRIYDDSIALYQTLTSREVRIMALMTKGLTNAQISLELNITVRTVESHRSNMKTKISAKDLKEVIEFCSSLDDSSN